ncbi:MAG: putative phosphodiesterase, partial [Vicingaceae bacterium]
MSKAKNIKIPSNKILLFGGVYSNLQALQQMQRIASEKGFTPDEIICNGDIVGYCAQPEESVQLIKEWGIHNIIGNVEENLREGADDCGCDFDEGTRCDIFSRQWYPFAQKTVSKESVDWMKELPNQLRFEFGGKKWAVVHGSPDHISEFIFNSTSWQMKKSHLNTLHVDGIIAGHS